jgi:hypothetical protein
MAEASEKLDSKSSSPTDDSLFALDSSNKEFAPISAPSNTQSRSNSHVRNRSNSIRSMSRTRSNNGYGCDDMDEDTEVGGDVEAAGAQDKDPFEVRWDDGDNDPMNPRNMSMARKWVVVLIVSASSLCV